MDLTTLVVATLAVSALVEFQRHSDLLSEWRVFWNTTPFFLSRLLRCPFCFSHWAGLLVTAACVGPYLVFGRSIGTMLLYLPMVALATVRAANVLNDLTHAWSRSPSRGEDSEVTDDEKGK